MHVLVIRFSAMGDVALTAPVIHSLLDKNPELNITLVSNHAYEPFFNQSDRFYFHKAYLKTRHKGFWGLRKLYKELRTNQFDAVVDLHDVLRSKVVRRHFKRSGHKILIFDKGRKQKQKLLKPNCEFKKLPHTTERYFKPFEALGLKTGFSPNPWTIPNENQATTDFMESHKIDVEKKLIGLAPFARHEAKIWGTGKIHKLIPRLTEEFDAKILLFGGGERETKELHSLNRKFPETVVVAGKLDLSSELQLMRKLDVMVSMDSSNMHLMCILGRKVVSIWGGTHHFVGFGPLGNEDLIVEVSRNNMPCRPSTIYGKTDNKKALECAKSAMKGIKVEMVLEKVKKAIV